MQETCQKISTSRARHPRENIPSILPGKKRHLYWKWLPFGAKGERKKGQSGKRYSIHVRLYFLVDDARHFALFEEPILLAYFFPLSLFLSFRSTLCTYRVCGPENPFTASSAIKESFDTRVAQSQGSTCEILSTDLIRLRTIPTFHLSFLFLLRFISVPYGRGICASSSANYFLFRFCRRLCNKGGNIFESARINWSSNDIQERLRIYRRFSAATWPFVRQSRTVSSSLFTTGLKLSDELRCCKELGELNQSWRSKRKAGFLFLAAFLIIPSRWRGGGIPAFGADRWRCCLPRGDNCTLVFACLYIIQFLFNWLDSGKVGSRLMGSLVSFVPRGTRAYHPSQINPGSS